MPLLGHKKSPLASKAQEGMAGVVVHGLILGAGAAPCQQTSGDSFSPSRQDGSHRGSGQTIGPFPASRQFFAYKFFIILYLLIFK
jgi:hypothetical protein